MEAEMTEIKRSAAVYQGLVLYIFLRVLDLDGNLDISEMFIIRTKICPG
jgi:hypothetical protein